MVRLVKFVLGFIIVALTASACTTANVADATLRPQTTPDLVANTPARIHLEGIKPTDPHDQYRKSTAKVTIITQTGMRCTETIILARNTNFGVYYEHFDGPPWHPRVGLADVVWCPDQKTYFQVEIIGNHGVVTGPYPAGHKIFGPDPVGWNRWKFKF